MKERAQPKPSEIATIYHEMCRELDRAARQLDGLSKSLRLLNKRLKEAA